MESVLLVDDQPANLQVLFQTLKSIGFFTLSQEMEGMASVQTSGYRTENDLEIVDLGHR
jgi:hypothetical protein